MISSHKMRASLASCIVLALAVSARDAGAQPTSAAAGGSTTWTATDTAPDIAVISGGGGAYGGVGSDYAPASIAVATPARYGGWSFGDSDDASSLEMAMVIPNKETDAAATARIIEDLAILSRIIEKNVLIPYGVSQTGWRWREAFVGMYASSDAAPRALFPVAGRPKSFYIGGYGATFFIRVDFPLLPPADEPAEQNEQAQEDPVWAQTRRSLLESNAPGRGGRAEPAGQQYSQAKVDGFRKSLIATMKYASNIRGLEPGESVVIVVQSSTGASAGPERGRRGPIARPTAAVPRAGRSVMTLRATKADVDACARGQLNQDQFEKQVQVITY